MVAEKLKFFRPLSYARRFLCIHLFRVVNCSAGECSSFIMDGSPLSPLWLAAKKAVLVGFASAAGS